MLQEQLQYIDGITIIDTKGTILFTVKFNPEFHSEISDDERIVGENLFSVFPLLNESSSTLIQVMKTGNPIFRSNQEIVDFRGVKKETTNISLPIKAHGKVVGAIELSKDLSRKSIFDSNATIEVDSKIFTDDQFKTSLLPERALYTFEHIISMNKEFNKNKEVARKFSKGNSPVFICGETGTGKELFAHAIHNESNRSLKPFVAQNCAALPDSLIEGILFGTKKGSYTGAEDNPGLFELADGGTLFLDEINSMPIHLQSKLLRVLEDGYVRRLGDTKLRKIDTRIIAASNLHPAICIKEGKIRQDLFYRLGVAIISIPSLRERKEDIPFLTNYFISKHNKSLKRNISRISKDVLDHLVGYDWPGNVRELENIVEFALNQVEVCEDTLQYKHIENQLNFLQGLNNEQHHSVNIKPLKEEIHDLEKERITQVIRLTKGNVSKAAKLLQIPRQTLQKKITQYSIACDCSDDELPEI